MMKMVLFHFIGKIPLSFVRYNKVPPINDTGVIVVELSICKPNSSDDENEYSTEPLVKSKDEPLKK